MDNQIEHHLPLITSRLVFAPSIFLPPPTVTNRMKFPSINIATRDDSPVPEQPRARTPREQHRARTPAKRASTPRAEQNRSRTPGKRAGTPRASAITRPVRRINTAVVFASDLDLGPHSPLTDMDDDTEQEKEEPEEENEEEEEDDPKDGPKGEDEDMLDASEAEHSDEGVGEKLIPKPKGEAGRPCTGGYNLIKTLGWNQRTYDSVQAYVAKVAKDKLDTTKSYRGQVKKKVQQLVEQVREKYEFIADYSHDWPVHDMLKLHLKYKSQTARNLKSRAKAEAIDEIAKKASSSGNKD